MRFPKSQLIYFSVDELKALMDDDAQLLEFIRMHYQNTSAFTLRDEITENNIILSGMQSNVFQF